MKINNLFIKGHDKKMNYQTTDGKNIYAIYTFDKGLYPEHI